MDDFRLDGKRIVVTGAASGIGRAIAIQFAHAGAEVILLDLNVDHASEVGLFRLAPGGNLAIFRRRTVDVSAKDSVEVTLVSRIRSSHRSTAPSERTSDSIRTLATL